MVVCEIKVLLFRFVGKVLIFFVVLVMNGVIRVLDYKNKGNLIVLMIIIWMSLFFVIISRVGVIFIVIILLSGKSLLLGRIMVFNSIIGVNMLVVV